VNIPPEVARAQGHHGIKGASHGVKGGRPRLELTADERKERRRKQYEAWRRRNGIFPKPVLTWEERRELDRIAHAKEWDEIYRSVWHKLPGQPLSSAEFVKRFSAFRSWVKSCRERNFPLAWRVDFVCRHYREIGREEREKERNREDLEERLLHVQEYELLQRLISSHSSNVLSPSAGRNAPCPCGSSLKFKKCCGR